MNLSFSTSNLLSKSASCIPRRQYCALARTGSRRDLRGAALNSTLGRSVSRIPAQLESRREDRLAFSPAWIVEAVRKHFGGLVGAVEVRVAPWDGIRHVAHVCVHVQPEHRACEVTEKLEDDISAFCFCYTLHLR